MFDFHCLNPEDMHNKVLAERVGYLKNTKDGNAIMCKIVEEVVNDQLISAARNLIDSGNFTAEQIAELLNLPVSTVKELMEKHSA